MADFATELANSIFNPGTSPALLIATNVSFLVLQLVLLGLLIATQSIHFVILSIISAGLWGGINWFVLEVRSIQEIEEKAEEIRAHQILNEPEATSMSTAVEDNNIILDNRIPARAMDDSMISSDEEYEKVDRFEGLEMENKKGR